MKDYCFRFELMAKQKYAYACTIYGTHGLAYGVDIAVLVAFSIAFIFLSERVLRNRIG